MDEIDDRSHMSIDGLGDTLTSLSQAESLASEDDELASLYARLGMALYEQTKNDEDMYLRCPTLYLAIAQALKDKK